MNWRVALLKRWIPEKARADEIWATFMTFAVRHFHQLCAAVGEARARAMYTEIAEQLGREMGERLRAQTHLTAGRPQSAVDAWQIAIRLLRFRAHITPVSNGRAVDFDHVRDPLWEAFRQEGVLLCDCTCIPMTRAIARVFWPDAEVEWTREPTDTRPCIKRLILSPPDDVETTDAETRDR